VVSAALVALIGLIAIPASLFPQRTPQQKSIAERVAAGETVILIDSKGLLAVPTAGLPGREGGLVVGREGYAALSSAAYGAVELSGEELPWPVRVRAEYAITAAQDERSFAGIYLGRKSIPDADTRTSIVLLGHRTALRPGTDPPQTTETAGFEVFVWDRLHPHRMTMAVRQREARLPRGPNPPLEWQTVEAVVDGKVITGSWNGLELNPVTGAKPAVGGPAFQSIEFVLGEWARDRARFHPAAAPPQVAPPYIGPGVGVCVFGTNAVYRNVTLSPARP
jgi:hypothetical protein